MGGGGNGSSGGEGRSRVEEVEGQILHARDPNRGDLRADLGGRGHLLGAVFAPHEPEPAKLLELEVLDDLDMAAVRRDINRADDSNRHAAKLHRRAHVEPLDRLVEVRPILGRVRLEQLNAEQDPEHHERDQPDDDEEPDLEAAGGRCCHP